MTSSSDPRIEQQQVLRTEAEAAVLTIAHRILGELLARPAEQIFEAAAREDLPTGTNFNEHGISREAVSLAKRYPSPAELMGALASGEREALCASPLLLTRVDPLVAAPLVMELLPLGHRVGPATVAAWVFGLALRAVPEVVRALPLERVIGFWLEGSLPGDHVPIEIKRRAPIDALADALHHDRIRFNSDTALNEVLGGHPELATEDKKIALLRRIGPRAQHGELQLTRVLMNQLGEARSQAAIPLLLDLRARGLSADDALLAVGGERALGPLAAELDGAIARADLRWDPHHVIPELRVPVEATFRLDPRTSTERFARVFTPAALSTGAGKKLAHDVLAIGRGTLVAHDGVVIDTPQPGVLAADPRWLDVAAQLLPDHQLAPMAKSILADADKKARQGALTRAGTLAALDRIPRYEATRRPAAKDPRWLERYQAGEHVEVWGELHALGAVGRDDSLQAAIEPVVRETMRRVRHNLEIIARALAKLGKLPKRGLAAPDAKASESIAAIEALVGGAIPPTLRAFYEIVGAVDLSGAAWWQDLLAVLDPLVIVPPKEALKATKAFASWQEQGLPKDLRGGETGVYLGPDPARKGEAGSGEPDTSPYLLFGHGGPIDGLVRQFDKEIPFVDYLRACCAGGGAFPLDGRRAPVPAVEESLRPLLGGLLPL